MSRESMTFFGYEILCCELKNLKDFERPNIIKEIDVARSYGDLKENAEYHAAKERQVFIESRINELSILLSNAQVIDPSKLNHDRVSFGSTVKIMNLDNDKEITYTIVGSVESNPSKGLISIASPIARSLMGKEVGDEVRIVLPSGDGFFEILDIFYKEIKFEA